MSGLQNVRSSKRPVAKNIHKYSVFVVGGNPKVLLQSYVCRQSDGCVLFSIFEVFLSFITIMASNK